MKLDNIFSKISWKFWFAIQDKKYPVCLLMFYTWDYGDHFRPGYYKFGNEKVSTEEVNEYRAKVRGNEA